MSNSIAKIQHKGQVTIPTRVRNQAGISKGDLVEFSFRHGHIIITPKLVIDRSQFPTADDEYTPAQRRAIDALLKESLAEVKKGHRAGPFNTADEMITSIKRELKKSTGKKSKPSAR